MLESLAGFGVSLWTIYISSHSLEHRPKCARSIEGKAPRSFSVREPPRLRTALPRQPEIAGEQTPDARRHAAAAVGVARGAERVGQRRVRMNRRSEVAQAGAVRQRVGGDRDDLPG